MHMYRRRVTRGVVPLFLWGGAQEENRHRKGGSLCPELGDGSLEQCISEREVTETPSGSQRKGSK